MTEQELLNRIEELAVEVSRLRNRNAYLERQVAEQPAKIKRTVVEDMYHTAVNCGNSGTCAVAGWAMERIQREDKAKAKQHQQE